MSYITRKNAIINKLFNCNTATLSIDQAELRSFYINKNTFVIILVGA